jgi:iron complex outermembrane receptor protein
MLKASAWFAHASGVALIAAAGLQGTAQAQVAAGSTAPDPDPAVAPAQTLQSPSRALDDIVVTATKRSERLQDVPVSVTVVTRDILERNNVRELGDLTKIAPNLTINYGTQPGNFSINMRGIGTFSNGIAVESDVAVVIDDVPVGFQAAAFKDLIDLERVEVLRGPQSTLFGKSAIAGVLNITTQAPTAEMSGRLSVLATNDREYRVGGTVAGPLSDTIRVRLTGAYTDYAGNVLNLTTGKRENGSRGVTFTGKIDWSPTENFQLRIAPRFNDTSADCCTSPFTSLTPNVFYQGIRNLPSSQLLAGIPYNSRYNPYVRHDERNGSDSRTFGATVRLNYDLDASSFLGAASITSITSFDKFRMRDYQDIDDNDVPFLLYYPVASPSGVNSGAHGNGYFHARSLTQELRLTSPGNRRFTYVAGLWYARNVLDRYFDRGPILIPARYIAESSNSNYAVFAQASLELDDKTKLIGGARLNKQDIDYRFRKYLVAPQPQVFGQADSDTASTVKAGIQRNWTPDVMTYFTYSTGYKGQAYDLVSTFDARIAAQMPVPPETARNFESGLKSAFFGRRLYLNVTAFRADFYGFQTSITESLPNGTFLTFLNSVGHLRTRGVEVDALARVGSRLRLNAAGAWTDAEVADFPNGPCYPGQTLAQGCRIDRTNSRVQNLAGKRLNNAPVWKFNVGGQYDLPLSDLPVNGFATFAYRWQDDINFALSQDPLTVQKAYGILDLSMGVTSKDARYKLTVFVNNVFDKHYAQGLGNNTRGYSAPGVTVTGTNWFPARDSFRYAGVRADVSF